MIPEKWKPVFGKYHAENHFNYRFDEDPTLNPTNPTTPVEAWHG
ncbi:MAG: hypothetical protein JWR80_2663 [Bradyrhizobium sp.]|nr:hypothetical protein [Bradyrhizobium sp.]